MNNKKLDLTPAEYEQIICDIEGVLEEMEMLSDEVDFYVTDYPDRLRVILEILTRDQE